MARLLAKELFEERKKSEGSKASQHLHEVISERPLPKYEPLPEFNQTLKGSHSHAHPYLRSTYQDARDREAYAGPWKTAPKTHREWVPDPFESTNSLATPYSNKRYVTMSKGALVGMIVGLLLLGGVFFMAGYLVAMQTYDVPRVAPTPVSWADVNTPPGTHSGSHTGGVMGVFKSVPGGHIAQQQVNHAIAGVGGLTKGLVNAVPKPLQPFAQNLQDRQVRATQGIMRGAVMGRPPSSFMAGSAHPQSPTGPYTQTPMAQQGQGNQMYPQQNQMSQYPQQNVQHNQQPYPQPYPQQHQQQGGMPQQGYPQQGYHPQGYPQQGYQQMPQQPGYGYNPPAH